MNHYNDAHGSWSITSLFRNNVLVRHKDETDTEYEVGDVGWLIHEEGEWRFVPVSGAACSVDLWRPIATKDKEQGPRICGHTEPLQPLRERELYGRMVLPRGRT